MQSYDVNTYAYDGRGRRIQKNGITYTYDSNDRLIASSDGFEYYYDQTGVFAIKYNGEKYVFQRDMLGNVIAILDNTGAAVVKYTYDAWGNHTISGTEATTIGVLNPIRYRGYFFDTETGLYFLQTRYYDPEVGRFLNMDAYAYADPETVNGLNLYAYCGNNPVMYSDPSGTTKWWEWLIAGVITVGLIAGAVALTVATGGGFLATVLTGAAIGATLSVSTQSLSGDLNWSEFLIDTVVGSISGAFSYGAGAILSSFGSNFGAAISQMSVQGLEVGKVFSANLLSSIGSVAGKILGGFMGGMFIDKQAYYLFKDKDSLQERINNNIQSTIFSSFLDFLVYLW